MSLIFNGRNIMRELFRSINWHLETVLGLNIRRFLISLFGLKKFIFDYIIFLRNFNDKYVLKISLGDHLRPSGEIENEYFFQDLYVARKIYDAKPKKHIDVGSRIDGFVAHIATFREIEVYDIRPQPKKIKNIVFFEKDIADNLDLINCSDSVSCLHALEHFGLGRYGDKINPDSFDDGFTNLAKLLSFDGVLYLSIPIGISKIYFNSNRISDPFRIINLADQLNLKLINFAYHFNGNFYESIDIESDLKRLSNEKYALGIYIFRKML